MTRGKDASLRLLEPAEETASNWTSEINLYFLVKIQKMPDVYMETWTISTTSRNSFNLPMSNF